ncbi:protein of unknown function [Xenorhabdus doucetiae]|uniref:Uncharacterized protein n=1 Tax=Xenorhabdus doucetiae TaxID=351671 RepID=A0A068QN68_9GAMM|nr:protein of unknown function [Xenorhabdus doucetiae]
MSVNRIIIPLLDYIRLKNVIQIQKELGSQSSLIAHHEKSIKHYSHLATPP